MQVKLFAALATLTIVFGAQAATAQRTADGARALEGGWVRLDTTGSGSFGGNRFRTSRDANALPLRDVWPLGLAVQQRTAFG